MLFCRNAPAGKIKVRRMSERVQGDQQNRRRDPRARPIMVIRPWTPTGTPTCDTSVVYLTWTIAAWILSCFVGTGKDKSSPEEIK